MKTIDDKQKFIEFRAKGISFAKIAENLGISKPTLIKWDLEYKKEISNLRYLEFETLLAQYRIAKEARIEAMAATMNKALNALKTKLLDELSTKDLLSVIAHLDEKLRKELESVSFVTNEYSQPEEEMAAEFFTPKTLPFPY